MSVLDMLSISVYDLPVCTSAVERATDLLANLAGPPLPPVFAVDNDDRFGPVARCTERSDTTRPRGNESGRVSAVF
jgi:hypothetical protein